MVQNISRRQFLRYSTVYAAGACCAAAFGPLGTRMLYAQTSSGPRRTLVFLNQFGGNDHLNSWAVPYTNAAYFDRRPGLAIPANQVLPMSAQIGLNPVLANIHSLYRNGDVCVIQGAGDPVGSRSHFTSQEYFSRGLVDTALGNDPRGWIGRFGDVHLADIPFNTVGIGVGSRTDFTSFRASNRPIVSSNLSSLGLNPDRVSSREVRLRQEMAELQAKTNKPLTPRAKSVQQAEQAMYGSMDVMRQVVDEYNSVTEYPSNSLGSYFMQSAQLVQTNRVGTQVIYGGIGGWDTHSGQRGGQDARLGSIDAAIGAFSEDVKAMGRWNEVAICIFTEFGRNTFKNGSDGTDHGWGGAMVVIGGGVKGGVLGSNPSDSDIRDRRWINQDVDFRNVFSEMIAWSGHNPSPVFPENFSKVSLGLFS